MAQMTPQISELLEKALALSSHDRGLLIDRLVESLDEGPAEEGVEEAWAEEIKRRVDDIRSGKTKMIPGEEVRRRLTARLESSGPYAGVRRDRTALVGGTRPHSEKDGKAAASTKNSRLEDPKSITSRPL